MNMLIELAENDPNHASVTMVDGSVKKNKYVDIENLVDALEEHLNVYEDTVRTGPMPRGFVDSNFDYRTLTGRVAVYMPAAVRRMNFNGEKAMIPFPNIVLIYEFKNGVHNATQAFSVKEDHIEKVRSTTKLYNYPFGNVSPGGGHVCWGSNEHEKLNAIADINIFTDKFLNSLTNQDLYQVGISNSSQKILPEFLNELKEQVEKEKDVVFNPDYLVETTFTLDSIMGRKITKKI